MDDTLTKGLVGDVMFGRTIDDIISQKNMIYPRGNIMQVMKETDMNVIDLETTLTHSRQKGIQDIQLPKVELNPVLQTSKGIYLHKH